MSNSRRILYVQYYNPAAYPPLEHSSSILADAGWSVRFLGVELPEVQALQFPPHERVAVSMVGIPGAGWRQKLHYLGYTLRVLWTVLTWRPGWIYASDLLAAPVAWLAKTLLRARVVYHEHDSPRSSPGDGGFHRVLLAARRGISRAADAVVLPNEARARELSQRVAGGREAAVVWNCPLRSEVRPARAPLAGGPIRVLYHGSIVPERLPLSVLRGVAAASEGMELVVAGYQPAGAEGYVDEMRALAAGLGMGSRFHYVGPVPRRDDLLALCATCDVGIALMPMHSDDFNNRTMYGASNKAFDYLACGLALVVSDLPGWRELFVDTGFGVACDPDDEASLAAALRWYADHPDELRRMGERGRSRVATGWNYETQFAELFGLLSRGAERSGLATPDLSTAGR